MTFEETIAEMERRLVAALAKCDGEACSTMLADDFTAIVAVEGRQLDVTLRQDWLTAVSRCEMRTSTVDDTAVSVHGEVAIATVLWTEKGPLTSTQLLVTDIWMRSNGDWKLTERHAGRPAAPDR